LRSTKQALEAAKGIAQQSEGLLFSTLDEELKQVGNAIDAGGRPFHPNMMWDGIERMESGVRRTQRRAENADNRSILT
jgi:hypothetical protein